MYSFQLCTDIPSDRWKDDEFGIDVVFNDIIRVDGIDYPTEGETVEVEKGLRFTASKAGDFPRFIFERWSGFINDSQVDSYESQISGVISSAEVFGSVELTAHFQEEPRCGYSVVAETTDGAQIQGNFSISPVPDTVQPWKSRTDGLPYRGVRLNVVIQEIDGYDLYQVRREISTEYDTYTEVYDDLSALPSCLLSGEAIRDVYIYKKRPEYAKIDIYVCEGWDNDGHATTLFHGDETNTDNGWYTIDGCQHIEKNVPTNITLRVKQQTGINYQFSVIEKKK